jgi:hypothetical protein
MMACCQHCLLLISLALVVLYSLSLEQSRVARSIDWSREREIESEKDFSVYYNIAVETLYYGMVFVFYYGLHSRSSAL